MSSSTKPMSALVSALRSAGRQHLTASTVAAREPITGSHVFRIHGYKQIRKTVPNGTVVESPAFDVGGHRWKVQCYPNGDRKEADGSTSIFLTSLGDATAEFKLSVLDHDGEPSVNGAVQQQRYSANRYWGWIKFLDKENPNHNKHLEDDCLTILCDVTVDPGLRAQAEVAAAPPFDLRGQLAEALWNKHPADVEARPSPRTGGCWRPGPPSSGPTSRATPPASYVSTTWTRSCVLIFGLQNFGRNYKSNFEFSDKIWP
ncbi:BTB/POZ and MATH domain-containing protein 3-like [Aegilops tauschii subsp. strangulata]|uniref:BTB/POZ and MATH domain-containing protein 3-like n=1 Tax=Aegilops tauschii subsp. strangulata TaxID=200361 RepID=UPI003CC8D442